MNKMKDQNKEMVIFHDKIEPNLKLIKKKGLKDSDFDGFEYSHDHSNETEYWIKQ
jgi:hypothetical protein